MRAVCPGLIDALLHRGHEGRGILSSGINVCSYLCLEAFHFISQKEGLLSVLITVKGDAGEGRGWGAMVLAETTSSLW